MWELDYKESWAPKNWWFWTVVLKTLESPLNCKEIQPVHPKGNQSWMFIGRTNVEAETPGLWGGCWQFDLWFLAFSKSSLNICKFTVHWLLKPGLEIFENYFASMWDECKCVVVWILFGIAFLWNLTSLVAQMVKRLPTMRETRVWSLGWEDTLEKEIATHSSTLSGKSHGWICLVGYSPWGHKELDTTEQLHFTSLHFFGTGMKTDLFQCCGHCWAFQICWHIECNTFLNLC